MKMTEGILQVSICVLVLPLLSSLPEDGSASWEWVPMSYPMVNHGVSWIDGPSEKLLSTCIGYEMI